MQKPPPSAFARSLRCRRATALALAFATLPSASALAREIPRGLPTFDEAVLHPTEFHGARSDDAIEIIGLAPAASGVPGLHAASAVVTHAPQSFDTMNVATDFVPAEVNVVVEPSSVSLFFVGLLAACWSIQRRVRRRA